MPSDRTWAEGTADLPDELLEDEWEEIRKRRAALGESDTRRSPEGLEGLKRVDPASGDQKLTLSDAELFGLGLSGGGIRSASFNLGLLQGLAEVGALRHVDYLSTVSGGGFTGSTYSALVSKNLAPFPLAAEGGSPALEHLRAHSNYLAPLGIVARIRILTSVLRGMTINAFVLLPAPLLIAAAAAVWIAAGSGRVPLLSQLPTFGLTGIFVAVLLLTYLMSVISRALMPGGRDVRSWDLRDRIERAWARWFLALCTVAFFEAQPVLLDEVHRVLRRGTAQGGLSVIGLLGGVLGPLGGSKVIEKLEGFAMTIGLIVAGALSALLPGAIYLLAADHLVHTSRWPQSGAMPEPWVLGALVAWAAVAWFVDVNDTSNHGFWRDRISAAFLFGDNRGPLPSHDNMKLSELSQDPSGAPYHLVNTSVNLGESDDLRQRQRRGDFFVMSKRWIGSRETGYCRTEKLEAMHPHLTLGTAVAISSAAAAPNMGMFTSAPLTPIMTMLNLRLGYWLPHPGRLAEAGEGRGFRHREAWRPGARWLWREMGGFLRGDTKLVNVSDGGHLENLGLYELLRRRCRYIIVGDGGADGAMTFGAIATIERYARLDLGIEIDIPLDDMRPGEDGFVRRRATIGLIRYPATDTQPAEQGLLLYVKAALDGTEDETIREYRSRAPTFPHESTADQFFSEERFEAYRLLGLSIIRDLVSTRPDGLQDMSTEQLKLWFRRLRVMLAPSASVPDDVEAPPGVPDAIAARYRRLERAVAELGLERQAAREHPANAGIWNQIRLHATDDDFRGQWPAMGPQLAESTQLFAEEHLGLSFEVEWKDKTFNEVKRAVPEAELDASHRFLMAGLREGADKIAWASVAPAGPGVPSHLAHFEQLPGYAGQQLKSVALSALQRELQEQPTHGAATMGVPFGLLDEEDDATDPGPPPSIPDHMW